MPTKPKAPEAPQPTFIMPAPNDDMAAYGWQLGRLRQPREIQGEVCGGPSLFARPGPLGADHRFLQPEWLEELCLADANLQALLQKAHRGNYNPTALGRVTERVQRIFEEQYLPLLIDQVWAIAPLLGQYFAARHAHYQLHPEELDPPPDSD